MKKYKIKYIHIFSYNSQANKWIEIDYKLITDALSKLMMKEEIKDEKNWVSHMSVVFWADRITINFSTEISSFRMLYEYEAVLSIKLNVSTWQTLNWHTVRIREKLIIMRACQIKYWDENIEEAKAHMQCLKTEEKKHYNQIKNLIK